MKFVRLSQPEQTHMVHVVATWLVLKHTLLEIESLDTLSMGPRVLVPVRFSQPEQSHVVYTWSQRGRDMAGPKT